MNSETSTNALKREKSLLFLNFSEAIHCIKDLLFCSVRPSQLLSLKFVFCVCVCVCLCDSACQKKLGLCLPYSIGIKNRRLGYAVLHSFIGVCRYIVGYLANTETGQDRFPSHAFSFIHSLTIVSQFYATCSKCNWQINPLAYYFL